MRQTLTVRYQNLKNLVSGGRNKPYESLSDHAQRMLLVTLSYLNVTKRREKSLKRSIMMSLMEVYAKVFNVHVDLKHFLPYRLKMVVTNSNGEEFLWNGKTFVKHNNMLTKFLHNFID